MVKRRSTTKNGARSRRLHRQERTSSASGSGRRTAKQNYSGMAIIPCCEERPSFSTREMPIYGPTGYVPQLDTYIGPETPNPLFITALRSKEAMPEIKTVLNDIMGLTKINYNSCNFNDGLPVTVRFANMVGDVLTMGSAKGPSVNRSNITCEPYRGRSIMTDRDEPRSDPESADVVPELPRRVLSTYARLWQLETWLRRMVYVELRALRGDQWEKGLPSTSNSFEADKRLTHMPTPETDSLSYAQLSTLKKVISDNWELFKGYFPPESIWNAKLEEISQIRHRVAHFRKGHLDDYQRLLQFLRDIDQGFWTFCTSYNDAQPVLPASDDPVVSHFLPYDPFPWTEVGEKKWARIGVADPALVLGVTVEVLRRPWAPAASPIDGHEGYLYDVRISGRDGRSFDYAAFLEGTKVIHSHLAHLMFDSVARSVRLTIPALLGAERVIKIVDRALEVGGYNVRRESAHDSVSRSVQLLADAWPEFVLGPENPLTFLSPAMKCSFFGV